MAPKVLGEVAYIPMDGDSKFQLNRSCFLAALDNVELASTVGKGLGWSVDRPILGLQASGKGALLIQSPYGALYRLSLQKGEEYYIKPRYDTIYF